MVFSVPICVNSMSAGVRQSEKSVSRVCRNVMTCKQGDSDVRRSVGQQEDRIISYHFLSVCIEQFSSYSEREEGGMKLVESSNKVDLAPKDKHLGFRSK